jgi:hypothetical protein
MYLFPLFSTYHIKFKNVHCTHFIKKERDCHTCFSKENQVQAYMHAMIKFHAYSDI